MIFQLSSLTTAVAVACSPRHHVRTRPRCCTPMVFLWFDFQTRAVIRVRIRCIVIRIRVRHAAIRIRVVVAAINHTVYWGTPPFGAQRYSINLNPGKKNESSNSGQSFCPPKISTGCARILSLSIFVLVFVLRFHFALRFVASLPFFASRLLVERFSRFVRFDAWRYLDFAAEGQTRAVIRVRMRCIVTRIRVRHAANRIRVVVAAINHTGL